MELPSNQEEEVLTFGGMVKKYADRAGISYQEAQTYFPKAKQEGSSFREFSVTLKVSADYKPKLFFYCEMDGTAGQEEILAIHSMQLEEEYNGTTKVFHGNISAWAREDAQIEYVVNGDFFQRGKTSYSVVEEASKDVPLVGCFEVKNPANHVQYYYDHIFQKF